MVQTGFNTMEDLRDAIYQFAGGFVISSVGNFAWIAQVQYNPSNIALEWFLKLMGTMIMGTIGGLAALFSKDLYKYLKKKITHLMKTTSFTWANFWKKTPVWAKRLGNGLMAISVTGGAYALATDNKKISLALFGCAVAGKFLTEFFADEPAEPEKPAQ